MKYAVEVPFAGSVVLDVEADGPYAAIDKALSDIRGGGIRLPHVNARFYEKLCEGGHCYVPCSHVWVREVMPYEPQFDVHQAKSDPGMQDVPFNIQYLCADEEVKS